MFIPNSGHKSAELVKVLIEIETLAELEMDIANCRGQSYDNASNKSGVYSALQAWIKALNPYAEFVPCAAHSLNLVGICAASSCTEAINFFSILQEL